MLLCMCECSGGHTGETEHGDSARFGCARTLPRFGFVFQQTAHDDRMVSASKVCANGVCVEGGRGVESEWLAGSWVVGLVKSKTECGDDARFGFA